MKPIINDATTALLRAICASFTKFDIVFDEITTRGWASATFVGARHQIGFRVSGDGADAAAARFVTTLDVHDFELRGHILADIALVERVAIENGARFRIEALTVEDG